MSARTLSRLGALAVALALPLSMTAAEAATTSKPLVPEKMKRGPATSLLHLAGGDTIVDRGTRVDVALPEGVDPEWVTLVGRSGDGYVLSAADYYYSSNASLLRVEADGTTTELADTYRSGYYYYGRSANGALSPDGTKVAATAYDPSLGHVLNVYDATTGDVLATRSDTGHYYSLTVLGFGKKGVLFSHDTGTRAGGRWHTSWWNPTTDATSIVVRKRAYGASVAGNRLYYSRTNGSSDGCSRVVPLHRPKHVLWQTCRHMVVGASPNGSRLVTIYTGDQGYGFYGRQTTARSFQTDGMPVRGFTVRKATGKRVAAFRARSMILPVGWEGNRTLVVHAASKKSEALVRCTDGDCKRATPARKVQGSSTGYYGYRGQWITPHRWTFAQQ